MDFGQTIKTIRITKGMKQEELATFLDVSQSTIACWESGRRTPKPKHLKMIADKLDIEVSELFGDYKEAQKIKKIKDAVRIATDPSLSEHDKTVGIKKMN